MEELPLLLRTNPSPRLFSIFSILRVSFSMDLRIWQLNLACFFLSSSYFFIISLSYFEIQSMFLGLLLGCLLKGLVLSSCISNWLLSYHPTIPVENMDFLLIVYLAISLPSFLEILKLAKVFCLIMILLWLPLLLSLSDFD